MRVILITLATTALLCGCVAPPSRTRPAPPAAEFVRLPAIHAQDADRERIKAEREQALINTPAGRSQQCRQFFDDIHGRGIIDGLAVEVSNFYLEALDNHSTEGAEEKKSAEIELLGFCNTAFLIAASNSQKPLVSAVPPKSPATASSGIDAIMDDMFHTSSQDCLKRIRDLNEIDVLSDDAMVGLYRYLNAKTKTLPERPRARFLRGHCAAVTTIWMGFVL